MEDSYRHKGLRKQLALQVKEKGISDKQVLKAIETIPRHLFLDNAFVEFAYQDKAFPIGEGQTISQPHTVAFQTELLDIKKGDKVLEVGTGSGYQTSVLLEMGAKVFTIERQKMLFDRTSSLLPKLGYLPKFFYGDGFKGLPAFAPFDKIIVTAGAPIIPPDLVSQLKSGGLMVIPVGGENDAYVMKRLVKANNSDIQIVSFGDFRFVPLLEEKEWGRK
ncbi:MAG: protein-L-isoaspartate(D-aspartate) O-methyltransferase [Bacteroidetes bacterium]|nr:protein-L-isoaspartate(D-aspartate) O-methyltransferase [Bacteroidota bacterium]